MLINMILLVGEINFSQSLNFYIEHCNSDKYFITGKGRFRETYLQSVEKFKHISCYRIPSGKFKDALMWLCKVHRERINHLPLKFLA